MKITLQIQLLPDKAAVAQLTAMMSRFNEAVNWLAGVAFEHRCANKIRLQKIAYGDLRQRFGLSSQTAILVVRRVCEAYKRDRSIRPEFRSDAAITYDVRTISFQAHTATSILTLDGRIDVPMIMGDYQRERFGWDKGQVDLMRRKHGKWFLLVTVEAHEAPLVPVINVIGVDLGVKNLAVTDDGKTFSGDDVEKVRRRYGRKRRTCQRTGTKSAKRKLHKTRKQESRYRKDQNHQIAKKIVAKAKDTGCAIAVEDLAGINDRTPVRKPQRGRRYGWAFSQLRQFITYKAALAGIAVVPVDPRNTSRTCSECGHCEKANRKLRDEFLCRHCGYETPADWNAAKIIRLRVIETGPHTDGVRRPIVGVVDTGTRKPVETTDKLPGFSPRST